VSNLCNSKLKYKFEISILKLQVHEVCVIQVVPVNEGKRGAVPRKIRKERQHLFPCFFTTCDG